MTEMDPALRKEFEEFIEDDIQLSNDLDDVKELIWQGFLFGLNKSREYPEAFKATCAHCNNSITENSEGVLVWKHDIAIEEGWIWDFDSQTWSCPDCATSG